MNPESNNIYVSDILEGLLDAKNVRIIARDVTASLIGEIHPKFDPITYYIGGKCMGYPCIWLLQQALDLSLQDVRDYLSSNYTSFFISLSTSIGDDLVDKDENTHIGHLGLFYLLLIKGLTSDSNNKEVNNVIYDKGLQVMMGMLNDKIEQIERTVIDVDYKFGLKIGAFFKMMAYEFLLGKTNVPNKDVLLEICERFGCWCSALDDFIDIERDIENKQYFTKPIIDIISQGEKAKEAILNYDILAISEYLSMEETLWSNINRLVSELEELATMSRENGFDTLAMKLEGITISLPETLVNVRLTANSLWTSKIPKLNT